MCHKQMLAAVRLWKRNNFRRYSGSPAVRRVSLKVAASAGAQSTPENWRLYRNPGCSSKTRAAAALASSSRPSFASGAASSM